MKALLNVRAFNLDLDGTDISFGGIDLSFHVFGTLHEMCTGSAKGTTCYAHGRTVRDKNVVKNHSKTPVLPPDFSTFRGRERVIKELTKAGFIGGVLQDLTKTSSTGWGFYIAEEWGFTWKLPPPPLRPHEDL